MSRLEDWVAGRLKGMARLYTAAAWVTFGLSFYDAAFGVVAIFFAMASIVLRYGCPSDGSRTLGAWSRSSGTSTSEEGSSSSSCSSS
jgi:hypothetical protein